MKILVSVCVHAGFSEALLFADSVSTKIRECSGSVVECLTRDRGAAGLSLKDCWWDVKNQIKQTKKYQDIVC